jgi:hypothetical protein
VSERRRRRPDDESGGGLPLFPLVLVVILAGLLLGGALAHFFGGAKSGPSATPIPLAALPSPVQTPLPIATAMPTVTPAPTSDASPTLLPSAAPSVTPSAPRASATPTHATAATVTTSSPRPKPASNLVPRVVTASTVAELKETPVPKMTLSPAPAPGKPHVAATASATQAIAATDDRAASLVRSYLNALAGGDKARAATYLARGTPTETFMTSDSHIESIRSASVGSQQYQVTADIQTSSGEYYVTFTVGEGPMGLQITDHYSIKPQ